MKKITVMMVLLLGSAHLPVEGGLQDNPGGRGPSVTQETTETASTDTAVSALQIPRDQGLKLIADIDLKLGQIDRSQFDIEALLDKLSFDQEKVIKYVRENVAFEDYNGVLRGAKGTLASRAGNSIDQAVLLAKMLNDIGLEARILEGSLPRAILSQLVLQKRTTLPDLFRSPESGKPVERKPGASGDFILPREVSSVASMLVKTLGEHDIQLENGPADNSQDQAAYYWVEYRDMPSKPWLAVHPAFTTENAQLADIKPTRYFAHSIDEELQQRISVQAFIERSWNGKLETVAITEPHEYPASNLSSVTFSYSVVPKADLSAAAGDRAEAEKLLGEATLFFPMFDFGSPSSGLAFDTAGNTLSAEDASSDKAAIFQTVGGRFGAAASAMATSNKDNSGETKPLRYVTRHWLEIVIKQPGQKPKIITRDIARWKEGETAFKLSVARTVFFRVETGALSSGEFLEHNLQGLKKSIETLMTAKAKTPAKNSALQFSLDAEVFLFVSDMISGHDEKTISYRGEPTIVARYIPYGRVDEQREGFDIVTSPRRVISPSDGQMDRAGTLLSGVADTWLEYKLFAGESWQQTSAFEKLNSRMLSSDSMTLLTEGSAVAIDQIPAPGREFILRDLSNRELVLFPGDAASCNSWWRVNPVTGDTLGMLDNGWGGAETSEYLTNLTIIFGKSKVAVAVVSCSSVVAFLRVSAVMSAWSIFNLDEAAGFQGLDICSQMPVNLQALCTATMMAASVAAQAGVEGISSETLKIMCLKAIF